MQSVLVAAPVLLLLKLGHSTVSINTAFTNCSAPFPYIVVDLAFVSNQFREHRLWQLTAGRLIFTQLGTVTHLTDGYRRKDPIEMDASLKEDDELLQEEVDEDEDYDEDAGPAFEAPQGLIVGALKAPNAKSVSIPCCFCQSSVSEEWLCVQISFS
jgi:hypothetical protein